MSESNNLLYRLGATSSLQSLFRTAAMGYLKESEVQTVQKFSRFTLQNNILSLASSFNNLDPFLDTPTPLYLVSSNAADTQLIRIEYVDQNRDLQVANVALTGTSPVALGSDYYCIYRMVNIGSVSLQGRVSISSDAASSNPADNVTFCEIPLAVGAFNQSSFNQSSTGIFSIPRGYAGFVTKILIGTHKGADVSAAAMVRSQGGVFRLTTALDVFQSTSVREDFSRLDAGTDLKPIAIAQTGGETFIEYDLVLVRESLLDRYL